MSLLEALILGILQGITEFLPISSSGHLELGKALLNTQIKENLFFSVLVHAATALSTIFVFKKEIAKILSSLLQFKKNEQTSYAWKIAFSMIPVGLVGLLFEEQIEVLFEGKIIVVGFMLIVTAILLLLSNKIKGNQKNISWKNAFIIGFTQAFAIMPGLSRSGTTIATGLLLGIERSAVAQFSFLMVLPPILGATGLKTHKLLQAESSLPWGDMGIYFVGFLAAFFTGIVACKWMLKLVTKSKLNYFAYYCVVVGILAILLSL